MTVCLFCTDDTATTGVQSPDDTMDVGPGEPASSMQRTAATSSNQMSTTTTSDFKPVKCHAGENVIFNFGPFSVLFISFCHSKRENAAQAWPFK